MDRGEVRGRNRHIRCGDGDALRSPGYASGRLNMPLLLVSSIFDISLFCFLCSRVVLSEQYGASQAFDDTGYAQPYHSRDRQIADSAWCDRMGDLRLVVIDRTL